MFTNEFLHFSIAPIWQLSLYSLDNVKSWGYDAKRWNYPSDEKMWGKTVKPKYNERCGIEGYNLVQLYV